MTQQQFDGNAALATVPASEATSADLVVVPQRGQVVPYELAGALLGVSRETVRLDRSLEHVRGPHGRNIGVTTRSLLRSRVVKSDEQRAIEYYEQGGDPLSLVSETGIPLSVARRTWNAYKALTADKRVQEARARRAAHPCAECGLTERQANAREAADELRPDGPRCAGCNHLIPKEENATP